MPYMPPSSEQWERFLKEDLGDTYVKSLQDEKNTFRLNQVNLIKSFESIVDVKERNNALLGACIYILEKITHGEWKYYYLISPQKSESFFKYYLGLGSTLATKILIKGLQVSESNTFEYKHKLIYLKNFYDLIQDNPRSLAGNIVDDASELLNDLEVLIERIACQSALDINKLLAQRPTQEAILREFKAIPSQYALKASNHSSFFSWVGLRKPDPKRKEQICFMKMLGEEMEWKEIQIKKMLSQEGIDKEIIQNLAKMNREYNYAVMYGFLIYCMKIINSEGSNLYLECQRVANIKHVSILDENTRDYYFSHLITYVADKIKEGIWTQTKYSGFTNVNLFFEDMRSQLKQIAREINTQDTDVDHPYLDAITANITSYGMRAVFGSTVVFTLGEAIKISGGTVLTLALAAPQATLLATLILTAVEQQLMTCFASGVAKNVNALMIYTAKQPFIILYSSIKQLTTYGHALISGKQDQENIFKEDDTLITDTLLTLLKLNDKIFPEDKKNIIRNILESEQLSEEWEAKPLRLR